jgi:tetratricopeptide (TPR) repeat protein
LNLLELADAEGARESFEKALELNSQLGQIHFLLGVLDLEVQEFESAIVHFQEFLKTNPEHLRTRVNVAASYARLGDYGRAMNMMTRVIESAEVDTRHHLMRTYVMLKRGEEMQPALAAAPNGAPLLGTLLQALVRRAAGEPYDKQLASLDSIDGDLDYECTAYLNGIISLFGVNEAGPFLIDRFQELVAEGVNSRVLLMVLSRALMSIERDEEAVDVLNEVVETYGSEKWVQYYLATAHENLKNASLTEQHLRECLRLDPSDPDVLNFLGYFLADHDEKLTEAQKLIERALQIDPENGFYLDSLGWIYFRQGKGALAVEYIRRAIRAMSSDDAILRDHLGDAYLLDHDIANAVAQWRRALRLDPDIEGVQEKVEKYLPRISE